MRSWIGSRHHGLTLVEVVAALALLGTLSAAILSARAAHVRQSRLADATLTAADLTDRMLADWHSNSRAIPENASGVLDEDGKLLWRTSLMANNVIEGLGGRVIRLTVTSAEGEGLFEIDLIAPSENPPQPLPTPENQP